MKHSLSTSGLSLSQAQSISNMCFQRTQEIDRILDYVNNAEKTIKVDGVHHIYTQGKPLPANVKELLLEKSVLHACQAFLMFNTKVKDVLINTLKAKTFQHDLAVPVDPEYKRVVLQQLINEDWGWEQLSSTETNEYLEQEAFAAHIGQFIHKEGTLSRLRRELPTIKSLEWYDVKDNERTPIVVNVHHKSSDLLALHNELAGLHRKHEMRVNYFKAKCKNLVTEENARISAENGKLQAEVNASNQTLMDNYKLEMKSYQDELLKLKQEFENSRQKEIQATSALRIQVDQRFQKTVDLYTFTE